MNEAKETTLTLYQSLARAHGSVEDLKAEAEKLADNLGSYLNISIHPNLTYLDKPINSLGKLSDEVMVDIRRFKEVLNLIRALEMHGGAEAGYTLTNDNMNAMLIRECKRLATVAVLDILIAQNDGYKGLVPNTPEIGGRRIII